jgi:hypothetical protein
VSSCFGCSIQSTIQSSFPSEAGTAHIVVYECGVRSARRRISPLWLGYEKRPPRDPFEKSTKTSRRRNGMAARPTVPDAETLGKELVAASPGVWGQLRVRRVGR